MIKADIRSQLKPSSELIVAPAVSFPAHVMALPRLLPPAKQPQATRREVFAPLSLYTVLHQACQSSAAKSIHPDASKSYPETAGVNSMCARVSIGCCYAMVDRGGIYPIERPL